MQGREQSIKELEGWQSLWPLIAVNYDISYGCASDEDRRRLYTAMQIRAEVDRDGTVRLSGIFDPEVELLDVLRDSPDPSQPLPRGVERHKVFVTPSANT